MRTVLKIIFIGVITTVFRIAGHLLMPAGEQTVLQPSIFVENGTFPVVLTLYALVAYSLIASMFFLVRNNLVGSRVVQGLKYGCACAVIWTVYLLEPLPHASYTVVDKLLYPIADSLTLLLMGVLLGGFFGTTRKAARSQSPHRSFFPVFMITACFAVGRLMLYCVFEIYSSFGEKRLETLVWMLLSGVIISGVLVWLNRYMRRNSKMAAALMTGGLFFGINLIFFNFFAPLIFDSDIPDLMIRSAVDSVFVTAGSFFLRSSPPLDKPGTQNKEK